MKRKTYKAGDVLVKQGSVAQALFILTAGVLVAIQSNGTGEEEAMRFAPGDSFGEAGLLAGAATMFTIRALTKATVYEIAKVDLAPILEERPAIAAELGEILARRVAVGKARLEEFADREKPGENSRDEAWPARKGSLRPGVMASCFQHDGSETTFFNAADRTVHPSAP